MTTITATYNGGTPGSIALTAVAYTGLTSPSFIGLTAPNLQASPGAGTDAVTTSALNCGSTSALLVGLSADASGSNTGLVGGTGFTQRISTNNGGTWGIFIEDPAIEVTGSKTATWTASAHSTDTYDSVAVCFADNAGGGATNGVVLSNGHPIKSGTSILYK
ncbi:MAG: hypothetical protein RB191_25150 [Terriglobia bacterium]|nr:hypothetical protein [Terriglobia bacterium]